MLIFNTIPGPFPWYDKIEKTNSYRKNCSNQQVDYKLISPKNALLPFQYRRPISDADLIGWDIKNVNTGATFNVVENIASITTNTLDVSDYFTYTGTALTVAGVALSLPYGFYNSYITFTDGSRAYSEMFFVPENSFNADSTCDYLILEWYNVAGDLAPFYYSALGDDDLPLFKCRVYLDTFITESQPVITQTTVKDGNDKEVPVFQKCIIPYEILLFVPDYLKRALMLIQLHDTINFTSADGIDSGQIDSITSQITSEVPGCMTNVVLLFEQDLAVVNRACSTNMIIQPPVIQFNYLKATLDDTRIDYDGSHNIVFTSPVLKGRSGYAVYSQQDAAFINFDYLTYDPVAGTFTISQPGYDIIAGYYIFVFYHLLDITLFP